MTYRTDDLDVPRGHLDSYIKKILSAYLCTVKCYKYIIKESTITTMSNSRTQIQRGGIGTSPTF